MPPEWYEIHVEGRLPSTWSNWFDSLDTQPGALGESILSGFLTDQAALHGVLVKLRDLNLKLISVNRRCSCQQLELGKVQRGETMKASVSTGGRSFSHSACNKGKEDNMKKVTAFVGSARKGNTYKAVAQFLSNLEAMGEIEYEIVRLSDYRLQPCRGCRVCFEHGEARCPLKDDRDVLFEKIRASDGLIFASPNYAWGVSAHMKLFLDRLGWVFHRPQFFSKTYTSIVTEGIFGGEKLVDYLDFIGTALFCNTVKGSCLMTLEPITEKQQRKIDKVLAEHARRYYAELKQPAYQAPTLMQLAAFRFSRTKIRLECERDSRDYVYYADQGWFESDYFFPVRLGMLKMGAGWIVDLLSAYMSRARREQLMAHR